MNERDTLAAMLRDEYELGDYWVSKSRLADAAYRGRDPMDDWRGLADRLIAAGVRPAPADTAPWGLSSITDDECLSDDIAHMAARHPSWTAPADTGLREAARAAIDWLEAEADFPRPEPGPGMHRLANNLRAALDGGEK